VATASCSSARRTVSRRTATSSRPWSAEKKSPLVRRADWASASSSAASASASRLFAARRSLVRRKPANSSRSPESPKLALWLLTLPLSTSPVMGSVREGPPLKLLPPDALPNSAGRKAPRAVRTAAPALRTVPWAWITAGS
jgi:hypothetical protein